LAARTHFASMQPNGSRFRDHEGKASMIGIRAHGRSSLRHALSTIVAAVVLADCAS
jgi:hypothetical protein